jgi:hypothetical protein
VAQSAPLIAMVIAVMRGDHREKSAAAAIALTTFSLNYLGRGGAIGFLMTFRSFRYQDL